MRAVTVLSVITASVSANADKDHRSGAKTEVPYAKMCSERHQVKFQFTNNSASLPFYRHSNSHLPPPAWIEVCRGTVNTS
jgi:hypothetical protein